MVYLVTHLLTGCCVGGDLLKNGGKADQWISYLSQIFSPSLKKSKLKEFQKFLQKKIEGTV